MARMPYPSDLTDAQWEILSDLIPPGWVALSNGHDFTFFGVPLALPVLCFSGTIQVGNDPPKNRLGTSNNSGWVDQVAGSPAT